MHRSDKESRMRGSGWSIIGRLAAALSMALVLGFGGRALADIGTGPSISDQPAATLLLPYFAVNLSNPNAVTTLISINNASATAVLAHVVIWSDLSVHVLDFDVYLTGYDVYRLNLNSLFINGITPETASAGQDPGDTISPKGPLSQDINFASCTGILPLPPVPPAQLLDVQNALQGFPVAGFGGDCAGLPHTDKIVRGYITIDTVSSCSFLAPGDPGYIGPGGTGIMTNQNVLWGDSFQINKVLNRAYAQDLVHITASATNPLTTTAGEYTFYGRYDDVPWDADDNRQPLSTTFAARYILPGSPEGLNYFNAGTTSVVWRDSKINQGPFVCGVLPSWFPLPQEGFTVFDEQEHVITPSQCHFSPCPIIPGTIPFPAETQEVTDGGPLLPTAPFNAGWIFLDLNHGDGLPGLTDTAAGQAWVIQTYANQGANSWKIGERAIQLDSASQANHFFPHL
jgi:hypothetical protein